MKSPHSPLASSIEGKTFLLLLILVSLAFGWVLSPFYGSVFWGAVLAIIFAPVQLRMVRRWPGRPTLASFLSVAGILLLVLLPMGLISALLLQEAAMIYHRVQSGELNVGRSFQQVFDALPAWATGLLHRFGLSDLAMVQARLAGVLTKGSQFFASQALNIGQNAFDFLVSFFIMLYLLFFFMRDGLGLVGRLRDAIPLEAEVKRNLASKFATVIRATVKGNIVVAMVQGALGGMIFWFLDIHAPVLWGVLMAFLSLVPAVGAALVWLPVAIYFLATGAVWQGVTLTAFGVLVIGLVDNLLRPLLVGKDTKMPDYVVLLSTLGGISVFGLNGFVIGPVIAAMFMAAWDLFAPGAAGKP
jgi:predicted PurR-regulated permease PerM